MQRRIEHLEDLVKRLIAQGQISQPTNVANQHSLVSWNDTPRGASVADTGSTVINGVHSVYKVADDWHNVLEEVCQFFFILPLSSHFNLLFFLEDTAVN
jgi:hypothetical protein